MNPPDLGLLEFFLLPNSRLVHELLSVIGIPLPLYRARANRAPLHAPGQCPADPLEIIFCPGHPSVKSVGYVGIIPQMHVGLGSELGVVVGFSPKGGADATLMQQESSGSRIVRFGMFELDVLAGELRKRGLKIKLAEQPLRVLEMLLANPGQLVTREELRSRLWSSGSIVDFDHSLNKAINKLREALGDPADSPRFVETIPRRGYRMISPRGKPSVRVESVAVLPLEDLSHGAQEYFADGLTEALIASLAQISALRVTSRTTAMTYKGAHKSLPEIARELGVDGVVEGTVLRSGKRVRISAQLIYTLDDTLLWAGGYEGNARDVLELQADVARAIAGEIKSVLSRVKRRN